MLLQRDHWYYNLVSVHADVLPLCRRNLEIVNFQGSIFSIILINLCSAKLRENLGKCKGKFKEANLF